MGSWIAPQTAGIYYFLICCQKYCRTSLWAYFISHKDRMFCVVVIYIFNYYLFFISPLVKIVKCAEVRLKFLRCPGWRTASPMALYGGYVHMESDCKSMQES